MTGDSNNTSTGPPVASSVAMKLLDVRLQPATAILQSLIGSFTAPKQHELVLLKAGGCVELHRLVDETSSNDTAPATPLQWIARIPTHSVLRSAAIVRYPGESKDCLVVTSDAGTVALWEFSVAANTTTTHPTVTLATLGKTGCRRDTVGQYCAADPAGRAVLVAAVEKRKWVLVVNQQPPGSSNSSSTAVWASPLAAHRPRTITTAVVGVDNGHGNPLFAVLEWQYPDLELNDDYNSSSTTTTTPRPTKQLAYYELDLGLNHVSRRWATTVPDTACCLAALPGRAVLVGAEDAIWYVQDSPTPATILKCAVPRRRLHPEKGGVLVTLLTVHKQRKGRFFCLAQTELGDVFQVSVQTAAETTPPSMRVALLDTLPVAMSLNISSNGLLFCAAEFGDHHLYRLLTIDIPDAPACTTGDESVVRFDPTSTLSHLRSIHRLLNPSPTTGILVGELAGNETSPQVYTLTGRGPHSALATTRHGAAVTELAVSELPGIPAGIYTIGGSSHASDRYIVVSFADATLVLKVLPGGGIEEEQEQSGFVTNAPTLACSALGKDGSIVQVSPTGVRQIDATGSSKEWRSPGLKRIEVASANEGQVLIALDGGEVIYFELDSMSGRLDVKTDETKVGADVCCLDVGTIAPGRSRSMLAAIGCRDQTVKIVSLEPGKMLSQRSSTALKSRPHSVLLQSMSKDGNDDLSLIIGLDDGSSIRASVDPITGSIGSSPTRRFLGARPVSVSRITLDEQIGVLLLSSRSWMSRQDTATGKHLMAPLSFTPLDHGCSFRSEAVPEAIIATAGKTLRILSVDGSSTQGGDEEAFNTHRVPLRYTPRQMTLLATAEKKVALVVVESDINEYGQEEKKAMGFDPNASKSGKDKADDDDDAMDMDEDSDNEGEKKGDNDDDEEDPEEKEAKQTVVRGPVPANPGQWGSCIHLLDPTSNCKSLDCVEMGRNEAALCCASVRFRSKGGEALLAVGTVTGMTLHPLKQTSSHIVLYRIVNGDRFQLLHRTEVTDGPVLAMAHFQGRLVVGVGKCLRLYEMGKRQLIRKYDLRGLPSAVKTIQTVGDRAFVGDLLRSMQVVRYDSTQNRLVLIAIDANPRPIVATELLDLNTVAVSDKFGNISILRVPKGAESTGSILDTTGSRALWEREESIPKLEQLCQYYVGEVVTNMTRAALVAGGPESLIYVTVSGRIAALVPFTGRDAVEFYDNLSKELRTAAPRPVGRDPWSYRSYYAPCMHVIDGELCDVFATLPHSQQRTIAESLELSIAEITKKLEDTRNSLL